MLKEALDVFEKMLNEKGDRLVIDTYVPKDGTYRLIQLTEDGYRIIKTLEIKNDKKKNKIIGDDDKDYQYIKTLDYYSKLLEMNKSVDPKKVIHSNNYLSLAVKKESRFGKDGGEVKYGDTLLNEYYEILANPGKKYERKSSNTLKLYEKVEKRIDEPKQELIERIKRYVKQDDIWSDLNDGKKDYVKLFFVMGDKDETIDCYKRENQRYIIPNIYNSNDFTRFDGEEIFGLHNNNMGMNAKKPFLENKSRKVTIPGLLSQKEALLQGMMFDYFWGLVSQGKYNIYVNNDEAGQKIIAYDDKTAPEELSNGYYMRMQKEKNEVEILKAAAVSGYQPALKNSFYLRNIIKIPDERLENSKLKYNEANDKLWEIKDLIDRVFYEGKLSTYFTTEPKDMSINDEVLKRCLIESRDSLAEWFYQGQQKQAVRVLDKFSLELIKNSVVNGKTVNAQEQFNLRWSLKDYFNQDRGMEEKMEDVRTLLKDHILSQSGVEWQFASDEEYAYAVGQAAKYLLWLSKSNNKSYSMGNLYFNAKNAEVIRRRLYQIYKKFDYEITDKTGGRINKLVTRILTYEPKSIKKELILAGFIAESIMYEKKEKESEDEQ